jgi:hypothetical protein
MKKTGKQYTILYKGALRSDRSRIIQEALHNNGLLGFEDIKEELSKMMSGIYI